MLRFGAFGSRFLGAIVCVCVCVAGMQERKGEIDRGVTVTTACTVATSVSWCVCPERENRIGVVLVGTTRSHLSRKYP